MDGGSFELLVLFIFKTVALFYRVIFAKDKVQLTKYVAEKKAKIGKFMTGEMRAITEHITISYVLLRTKYS